MVEPVRITEEDWETLLPVTEFSIGKTKLYLQPMGAEDVAKALESFKGLQVGHAIDFAEVPGLVIKHCPHVIARASGLHKDDVRRLPPALLLELVVKLVDINLKDYDKLVKNLGALAGHLGSLAELVQETSSSS